MSTRSDRIARSWRSGLLSLVGALGLCLLAAPAAGFQGNTATQGGGAAPPIPPGRPGPAVGAEIDLYAPGLHAAPATPFAGFDQETPGAVKIPQGYGGGYIVLPNGIVLRFLPWVAGDPIIEVILLPPLSGHPTQPERFLLQWPWGPEGRWMSKRPLLIGFHPFSISEKNIFNGQLPLLCAQRNWILLAPLGLSDINTANSFSQASLDAVLAMIDSWIDFDRNRIYTIGFSMGGTNAVSWAMRRQDPGSYRVAAVIDHTGPMDQVRVFNDSSPQVQSWLSNSWHFTGTPTQVPYAFDRVSPFRRLGTTADPNKAPVSNLASHIPFYVHYNPNDSQVELVKDTQALISYLQSKGAKLKISTGGAPGEHSWNTMNLDDALSWAGRFSLPADPPVAELFADDQKAWLSSEVRVKPANEIAHFNYTATPIVNQLDVAVTDNLQVLAMDLSRLGLDPLLALGMSTSSNVGGIQYVLKGYVTPPFAVTGFPLPPAWVHDPLTGELTITPQSGFLTNFTVVP